MKLKTCVPVLLTVAALLLWTAGAAVAGGKEHPEDSKEHPEHPEDSKEHPEHSEARVEVTMEVLGDAIEAYVEWDAELHGGHLYLYDAASDESLALTLDKVHRARLASLGGGIYFACADFRATNGHVYDLDVFMEAMAGSPFHGLVPTEIAVHKMDGKARYSWYEEGGIWKKRMK